jgi:hypothetical protein
MYVSRRKKAMHIEAFSGNQARPEGSIARAYVGNEALTFCSRYFVADDVATRFNQVGRNRENADLCVDGTSCLDHNVQILGAGLLGGLGQSMTRWFGMC